MNPISIRKTLIGSSIALTLGAVNAEAALITNVLGANVWSTDSANFTFLAANGGNVGQGTNDVHMFWDGNAYNASSDYTGPGSAVNITASSTAPFFGHSWTAHDIQVFTPGSYTFDVTLQTLAYPNGANGEIGTLSATVPTGGLGMHLLWDWNGNNNVDVFVVFSQNSVFGSGVVSSANSSCSSNFTGTITKNCLYDGPQYGSAGAPTQNQVWMFASTDGNGDGIIGIPMAVGGPLAGMDISFNANLTVVPLPAAVWLFGSGLMGLLGIARRRRR